MKYAYDRYARPNNDSIPTDTLLHNLNPNLSEDDCPEDIFSLRSKQESCKNVPSEIHIVPGLPLVQDQSK